MFGSYKLDIPCRPVVSSLDSPCYALADFLCKIISLLAANMDFSMKNSEKLHKINTGYQASK
jgi:hypothetical protein